MHEIYELIDNL